MGTFLGILVGLLVLSVMMLVHELGHFLAGKSLGFKIISFNLFMGPVLWKKIGKDGVAYTIRLIPMGASVEFAGEDSGINELPEDSRAGSAPKQEQTATFEADDPGLFFNRPKWARAIVVAMGPLVNFLTAALAFIILFSAFGGTNLPKIGQVVEGAAGYEAGLREGDRILSINGYGISTAMDFNMATTFDPQEVDDYRIRRPNGEEVNLLVQKEYEDRYRLGISYTPREDGRMIVGAVDPNSNGAHPVLKVDDEILSINGVSVQDPKAFTANIDQDHAQTIELEILREHEKMTLEMQTVFFRDSKDPGIYLAVSDKFGDCLQQGLLYPHSVIKSTIKGLGMIFSGEIKAKDGLTGPIGIVSMVGGVVQEEVDVAAKVAQLLMLFGLISVAVGFTNLLPIPPFDGFHLLILLIEGVSRKEIPEKVKNIFSTVGIILLLLLVAYVFYIDIARLIAAR